ncbi:uncharacterized protein WM294_002752 [Sarcoramphus papa]
MGRLRFWAVSQDVHFCSLVFFFRCRKQAWKGEAACQHKGNGSFLSLGIFGGRSDDGCSVRHRNSCQAGERKATLLLRRRALRKRSVSTDTMLTAGTVFVQVMKRSLATAGMSWFADVVFVEDGFRPLALRKLS